MNAAGLLAILIGALLIRQVVVGRVEETPGDLREGFLAIVQGDFQKLASLSSARGTNVEDSVSAESSTFVVGEGNSVLEDAMRSLGEGKAYVLGTEGPTAYDCSGLVWAALRKLGIYDGPRFNVTGFISVSRTFASRVSSPQAGDVVAWPGHHIGVVAGKNRMFSALNPRDGILESSISETTTALNVSPIYFRINYQGNVAAGGDRGDAFK